MKTVNVAELEGLLLDYSVAVATGMDTVVCGAGEYRHDIRGGIHCSPSYGCSFGAPYLSDDWGEYSPSTDWSQGGLLIEALEFGLLKDDDRSWSAIKDMQYAEAIDDYPSGPTPLIATCRAIVAAKFGDTVEVPEELL